MYVIQHKGISITDTLAKTDQGAWNLLILLYPSLSKYSQKKLSAEMNYTCRKLKTRNKTTGEYNV